MKRTDCQVNFLGRGFIMLVAFLCAILVANGDVSFAQSAKQQSPAVARPSAVEYTEAQIKWLQDSLNITEAQKPLWNNLTQVMRENAKEMDAFAKDRAETTKLKTMNAVEHLKYHRQITEAHLKQLNKFIPPFEALYASMSAEQKSIIDATFRTGKHGKFRRNK